MPERDARAGRAAARALRPDLSQRWRAVDAATSLGQAFAKYANAKTGRCLTAPPKPGLGDAAAVRRRTLRTQEIAFWWNA